MFNLNGPDGLQYHWHDVRKEKQSLFSRQQGGGDVISAAEKIAVGYTKILQDYLFPFAHQYHGESFAFQQDGASYHQAHYTKDFLARHNVTLVDWPAKSPDLN
ncbi:TPA: hypothetical protein N0F65_002148 [Lagenidium giganteum]|uniref:Tc1-like transposase DDE domain-containing protein n=1 Tax=Lagenidium giganteum TaxID=4803 RepID=A0AAV2YNV6_9STRA|nr:TPA: hypothetical protein N0F65_002148 [Lagenidium giganteum]